MMASIKSVEEIIREAIERGEFDNLPGHGAPIDLSDYFNTPEEVRLTYSLLKNAGILPIEIESFKEIEELRTELKTCKDDYRTKQINKRINELLLIFRINNEKFRN